MPEPMKEDWEESVVPLEKMGQRVFAGTIEEIPMERIIPPREDVRAWIPEEHIQSLAASIAAIGLLHEPVVIRRGDMYEIISGNCRYLACKRLGWTKLRCRVVDVSDEEVLFARLHENMFRADLSPVEKAEFLSRIKALYGMSDEEIGRWLGKSRAWVTRTLGVLRYPADIQQALRDRLISTEVAYELSKIADDVARQRLLEYAVRDGASRRLAQLWREDWEREQRAIQALKSLVSPGELEEKREEFLDRAEMVAQRLRGELREAHMIPTRRCDICNREHREDALVLLYACQDCVGVIRGAIEPPAIRT